MKSKIFRDDLLQGKVALVTGGGTGIGAAIAMELAAQGARVVIASRKAEPLARAAEAMGVLARPVDIRDRDAVNALCQGIVTELGSLDLLVNNGGGQFLSPAEAITPRGFDAVVATNLTGTWNVTRAAADAWMLAHGGRVVSITMLSQRGFPGMAHSVAARSGVEAMTRTLAVEWASRGILLNCVAPGFVASSGLKRYPPELRVLETLASRVPLKRLSRREEVAWMVAYLLGPAGDYVTGQTITVDGGAELWGDRWPIPDPAELPAATVEVDPWED